MSKRRLAEAAELLETWLAITQETPRCDRCRRLLGGNASSCVRQSGAVWCLSCARTVSEDDPFAEETVDDEPGVRFVEEPVLEGEPAPAGAACGPGATAGAAPR